MGFLTQAASPVADSFVMTLSTFFFCRSADTGNKQIIEWGDPTASSGPNFIGLNTISGEQIICNFCTKNGNAQLSAFDPSGVPSVNNPYAGDGDLFFTSPNLSPGSIQDHWSHILVAVDLGTNAIYDNNTTGTPPTAEHANYYAPRCALWINRANQLDLVDGAPPVAYSVSNLSPANISNAVAGTFSTVPFSPGHATTNFAPPDPLYGSILIAPWKMATNGLELAIPSLTADQPFQSLIRFAEFKLWFNHYIDGSFINLFIDGSGHPVDPSVAIAMFGAPAYHFRRNSKTGLRFNQNLGTAGSVIEVGTISDYTPGP